MEIDERKLREEFAASADLQAELRGDCEAYVAFNRQEAKKSERADRLSRRKERRKKVEVDESKLQQEFSESADLQNEFGDVESYLAFWRNEAAGRVKICGGNVETFSSPAPDVKIKKKRFKTIPISKSVQSAMAEAVARSKILEDEQQQVAQGVPCDADGVPLESYQI